MSLPADLAQLVTQKYHTAITHGDIEFLNSVSVRIVDGMPFLLSLTPSLVKKPERADVAKLKKDPFAVPEPELTVSKDLLGDGTYKLLLNRFPVIPEHLLLVTNKFKWQTSNLTPLDLSTTYNIVVNLDDALPANTERHIAFYNCGPPSGSSLDHKHLQILKLPKDFVTMQDDLAASRVHHSPQSTCEPLQNPSVPFAHFLLPLPSSPSQETLNQSYMLLLQKCLSFHQTQSATTTENDTPIIPNYNFIITKSWMFIVPRSNAIAKSVDIGFNATGYFGYILVKQPDIYKQLESKKNNLQLLLLECGFPSNASRSSTYFT